MVVNTIIWSILSSTHKENKRKWHKIFSFYPERMDIGRALVEYAVKLPRFEESFLHTEGHWYIERVQRQIRVTTRVIANHRGVKYRLTPE